MPSSEKYQYHPLNELDSIRIVVLHPSSNVASTVSCSLIHSTLHHLNDSIIDHYTALSYVWGDANDKRSIKIDGRPFSITATLDSALRHIRDGEKDTSVWADGICINQSDVFEKNKQVALIGAIYELARHTIIYLGDATLETDELMKKLVPEARYQDYVVGKRSGFLRNARFLDTGVARLQAPAEMHSEFFQRASVIVINHVLNRKWFTRVWVLQELVLSGDPWVQIGLYRVRWNVFTDLILAIHNYSPYRRHSSEQKTTSFQLLADMQKIRSNFAVEMKDSSCHALLEVLHSRRGSGAFDPRDLLYAHLGMYRRGKEDQRLERLIRVDYERSVADVYIDLALYLLRSHLGFAILSHVESKAFEDRNQDLPSWAPDWTSQNISSEASPRMSRLLVLEKFEKFHVYLKGQRVLGCRGKVEGIIKMIKDHMPSATETEALRRNPSEIALLARELDFEEECSRTATGIPHLEATSQRRCNCMRAWLGEDFEWCPSYITLFPPSTGNVTRRGLADTEEMESFCDWAQKSRTTTEIIDTLTDPETVGILSHMKVAVLDSKQIALVSRWAKVGDLVCRFSYDERVTYVFRRAGKDNLQPDLDAPIKEFFEKSDNGLGRVNNEKGKISSSSDVEHVRFVGDCVVAVARRYVLPTDDIENFQQLFALH